MKIIMESTYFTYQPISFCFTLECFIYNCSIPPPSKWILRKKKLTYGMTKIKAMLHEYKWEVYTDISNNAPLAVFWVAEDTLNRLGMKEFLDPQRLFTEAVTQSRGKCKVKEERVLLCDYNFLKSIPWICHVFCDIHLWVFYVHIPSFQQITPTLQYFIHQPGTTTWGIFVQLLSMNSNPLTSTLKLI